MTRLVKGWRSGILVGRTRISGSKTQASVKAGSTPPGDKRNVRKMGLRRR